MSDRAHSPPLIDVAPLRVGADAAALRCAAAIHEACVEWGFFVATGHGLATEMAAVFEVAKRFFALPQAAKELTPRVERYGYVPRREEALDPNRQVGITEYLDMGLGDEVVLPEVDGFATAVRRYERNALDVAARLLGAMAEMLDAGETFFAERMTDPQCRLRMIHYPAVDVGPDGEMPVTNHPHTDYGAITLLATDGVPGLEVQRPGGVWSPVGAPTGSLIVNLGDMLARWTNEIYPSTLHRVIGPVGQDRISVPFFINPDPTTIVEAIPSCVTADRPRIHRPVTAGEFLARRIDGV